MKGFSFAFLLFAILLAFSAGNPVLDASNEAGRDTFVPDVERSLTDDDDLVPVYEGSHQGMRLRRATCDLLSVSTPIGSLNHAACAAHCLALRRGFRGGRCKSGVCHCRK